MKKQEVSLWVGNFESEMVADKYFMIKYDEEGDRISSIFENNFVIDYYLEETYDDDFMERKFFERKKISIENLIEGSSYDTQLIIKFNGIIKNSNNIEANLVFLVYNFNYNGQKKVDAGEGYTIEYMGSVGYVY